MKENTKIQIEKKIQMKYKWRKYKENTNKRKYKWKKIQFKINLGVPTQIGDLITS